MNPLTDVEKFLVRIAIAVDIPCGPRIGKTALCTNRPEVTSCVVRQLAEQVQIAVERYYIKEARKNA